MPPRSSLTLKGQLMKSACSSFPYNPRNLENPWYGLWTMELLKLTEPFNNVVVIPQYALWYTLPEEEPEIEPIEEIDEDAASELEDGNEGLPIAPRTIPDGSAPQITPDFIALHIRAEELAPDPHHRNRFERRAGYRIIHECCPLSVEIKSFPSRRLSPADFEDELKARLGSAIQDLGFQCCHFFKMYEHALHTEVIAASGDHWMYRIVTRAHVPRARGDVMDNRPWDRLEFPSPVVLGTQDSDQRMGDISDYLHDAKPA
ncbi:hypothetical protein EDB87DRAFT_1576497 [Lactarius vividus]|nr:hypothetical protein EDB87DRAFT_1576497 [Lactarius vividus]